MTPTDRATLKALAEQATERPWTARSQQFDDWGMIRGGDGGPVCDAAPEFRIGRDWRASVAGDTAAYQAGPPQVAANAAYIVAACNALPALLALLDHVEGERDKANARIRELEGK